MTEAPVQVPGELRTGRVLAWRLTWEIRPVLSTQLKLGKQITSPGSKGGVWSTARCRCTQALPPRQVRTVLLLFRGYFYCWNFTY